MKLKQYVLKERILKF